jgi:hypothetical protein
MTAGYTYSDHKEYYETMIVLQILQTKYTEQHRRNWNMLTAFQKDLKLSQPNREWKTSDTVEAVCFMITTTALNRTNTGKEKNLTAV